MAAETLQGCRGPFLLPPGVTEVSSSLSYYKTRLASKHIQGILKITLKFLLCCRRENNALCFLYCSAPAQGRTKRNRLLVPCKALVCWLQARACGGSTEPPADPPCPFRCILDAACPNQYFHAYCYNFCHVQFSHTFLV